MSESTAGRPFLPNLPPHVGAHLKPTHSRHLGGGIDSTPQQVAYAAFIVEGLWEGIRVVLIGSISHPQYALDNTLAGCVYKARSRMLGPFPVSWRSYLHVCKLFGLIPKGHNTGIGS